MTETRHACTHDWPTTGHPINPDAVRRALAGFDRHYPAAVRSLAETTVPAATGNHPDEPCNAACDERGAIT
jgi:hypothetical protein